MSMSRRGFNSPGSEALATDLRLYARFVDLWRREGQRPLGLNELAWRWDGSPMGEAKVAVTMKAMVAQGYAVRVSPRTEQGTWEPTTKATETWPASGVAVMPEEFKADLEKGGRVSSVSSEEARSWDEDAGYTRLEPQRGPQTPQKELGDGKP